MRRASSSSVEDAFFSTKARAPERMALTTEFSSSYIERMTTLTLGQWRSSSVVASMPFMPGSPISMSTRSGLAFLHRAHGVGAVFGFAHDAELGPALQDRLDSIAHQLMIIDKNDVERHELTPQTPWAAARTVVPVSRVLVMHSSSPACAA